MSPPPIGMTPIPPFLTIGLFILCSVVSAKYSTNISCSGNISQTDYDGLQALYESMNGDAWKWRNLSNESIWSFPSPLFAPCSSEWEGVYCSGASANDCSIVALDLGYYGLVGPIPDEFYLLSSLEYLDLGGNQISGTISSSIAFLKSLTNLEAQANYLTGTIPSQFSNLSELYTLYLFDNHLSASIPTELGKNTLLRYLNLNTNELTGPFPTQLCSLANVLLLYLYLNPLTGSIPSCIGDMINLTEFYAFNTLINGTIPSEISNLGYLRTLLLMDNQLSGTLPTELGLLKRLEEMYLYNNSLTGTIPTTICSLQSLTFFDISANHLSGQIPACFNDLPLIQYVNMYENLLTGTIPASNTWDGNLLQLTLNVNYLTGTLPFNLSRNQRLDVLFVNTNYLTGTIADAFYGMDFLVEMFVDTNYFSGTLPSLIRLPVLKKMSLFTNLLQGTLPRDFDTVVRLSEFDVHNNAFEGSLPEGLGNKTGLSVFDISDNKFTGEIPGSLWGNELVRSFNVSFNNLYGSISSALENWIHLTAFSVQHNMFTSTVPYTVMGMLQSLNVADNYFSGLLPQELGACTKLISFVAANNFLSGLMPQQFQYLSKLQFLNVSRNMLSGTVTQVFLPADSFKSIVTLDISDNAFTGPLPAELFSRKDNLTDAILFSNCFSGSIPNSICEAGSLSVLVMDSVVSAAACDERFSWFLRQIFQVQIGKQMLRGSIPNCVWEMSKLTTLHLSGNGIAGTLGMLPTNSSLQYISLSSNRLTGSIPLSWQTSKLLKSIDLSSNRLDGMLSADYVINPNSSINFSVNRLSGSIPPAFLAVSAIGSGNTINILNENLFQCDSSNKPADDPNSSNYVCGSSNYNDSLIALATTLGLFGLIAFVTGFQYKIAVQKILDEIIHFNVLLKSSLEASCTLPVTDEILKRIGEFIDFFNHLQKSAVFISRASTFVILIPMILYVVIVSAPNLREEFSTHTHQYTWKASVAYMHGFLPLLLLLAYLVVLTWLSLSFYGRFSSFWKRDENRRLCNSPASCATLNSETWWSKHLIVHLSLLLFVCGHCSVLLTVNVLYVFAVLVGLPSAQLFLVQFALGVFKIFWSNVAIPTSLRAGSKLFVKANNQCFKFDERVKVNMSTFLRLFTFLVSPVLATFFTNDSCFRYVVTGVPSVTTSFVVQQYVCDEECYELVCAQICAMSSSTTVEPHLVSPSSASGIVSYATVTPSWIYSYQCSSALLVNYVPVLILSLTLSAIVIPAVKCCLLHSMIFWSTLLRRSDNKLLLENEVFSDGTHFPVKAFSGENYITRTYLNIGILLTFGLACPPLVIGVVLDCWGSLWFLKLYILRYISTLKGIVDERRDSSVIVSSSIIVSVSNSVHKLVLRPSAPLFMVLCVVACFWSIFAFDMIADVYGNTAGLVMIPAPAYAVLVAAGMVGGARLWRLPEQLERHDSDPALDLNRKMQRVESAIELNRRFTLTAENC